MVPETMLDRAFYGMTNYYVTLWKEEWLETWEAGEDYKCSVRTRVMKFWRRQQKTEVHREKALERKPAVQQTTEEEERSVCFFQMAWMTECHR